MPAKKTKLNRFYVAASGVTRNSATHHGGTNDSWAKPTLEAAIEHGRKILDEDRSKDEVFIIQIIRRVRRKDQPVVVEVVK